MKTFNQIKKHSESYAKMMRDLFPKSFEKEELNKILNEIVFDDEKTIFVEELFLQKKETEFKIFIYSLIDVEKKEEKEINKSVTQLLDEAGYNFYICETKEDVFKFKKYYKKGEVLCTFNNIAGRLNHYKIFWIISKNINKIKREDYKKPSRQDKYGTSCCSIQISKNDLSIKNRYNHTVNSPDNTFNNNLDNIIEGLSKAFEKEFGFDLSFSNKKNSFELQKFIFKNNKFIYYNYEINNIYYGINKIFNNGVLTIYPYDEFMLIGYYLINIRKAEIIKIDNSLKDCFFDLKFKKVMVFKKSKESTEPDEEGVLKIFK